MCTTCILLRTVLLQGIGLELAANHHPYPVTVFACADEFDMPAAFHFWCQIDTFSIFPAVRDLVHILPILCACELCAVPFVSGGLGRDY